MFLFFVKSILSIHPFVNWKEGVFYANQLYSPGCCVHTLQHTKLTLARIKKLLCFGVFTMMMAYWKAKTKTKEAKTFLAVFSHG